MNEAYPGSSGHIMLHISMASSSLQLSLSRLNHQLPGREAHPEVVQGTADFHHEVADVLLPQADPVFDEATALDTAVDMFDAQPALGEGLRLMVDSRVVIGQV
jgi:hypothetical protein